MIRVENECVGCDIPCVGKRACPLTHVHILECDKCHEEVDELYWYDDGSQVCKFCLREVLNDEDAEDNFEKVEVDDDDGYPDWSEDWGED